MAFGVQWSLKDSKNLRADELDRLFVHAKKDGRRTHLQISLAFNGAMRVAEVIHLRIEDFNFMNNKLSILPLKKAGRRRVKGRIIERPLPDRVEYPMPAEVMQMARNYIKDEKLKSGWLFPGNCRSCLIVKLNCEGGHTTKRTVQRAFDRVLERAKIKLPGRGIHSLKHARLTEVAQKTKDPFLVKELGRHESVAMSDRYVRYVNLQEKVAEIGGRT